MGFVRLRIRVPIKATLRVEEGSPSSYKHFLRLFRAKVFAASRMLEDMVGLGSLNMHTGWEDYGIGYSRRGSFKE